MTTAIEMSLSNYTSGTIAYGCDVDVVLENSSFSITIDNQCVRSFSQLPISLMGNTIQQFIDLIQSVETWAEFDNACEIRVAHKYMLRYFGGVVSPDKDNLQQAIDFVMSNGVYCKAAIVKTNAHEETGMQWWALRFS